MSTYDVERATITRAIREGSLGILLRNRINQSFFDDPDNREVMGWLITQYQKHGTVPSMGVVRGEFPEFRGLKVRDDLPVLMDRLRDKKLYGDIQRAVKDILTSSRGSSREALDILRKKSIELSISHSSTEDVDLSKAGAILKARYNENKLMKGKLGIPYPWPSMNRATKGKRRGQFIAFYGMGETMKTWCLLKDAEETHSKHGRTPLLLTKEMTTEEMMERWAALRAAIDFDRYEEGTLDAKEEKRFFRVLNKLHEDPPFVVTTIDSTGQAALAEIRAKCEEYSPDVLYIDGIYFLAEDTEWGSFADITRGLKQLAMQTPNPEGGKAIPVVATSQANRTGKGNNKQDDATDVGFGLSLHQDTDVLAKTIRQQQQREDNEIVIVSKKVRRGKPFRFAVNAFVATDFSEKYSLNEDMSLAEQGVDEGAGGIV